MLPNALRQFAHLHTAADHATAAAHGVQLFLPFGFVVTHGLQRCAGTFQMMFAWAVNGGAPGDELDVLLSADGVQLVVQQTGDGLEAVHAAVCLHSGYL